MKVLFIITTDDGETIYNAIRLANVGMKKGDLASGPPYSVAAPYRKRNPLKT